MGFVSVAFAPHQSKQAPSYFGEPVMYDKAGWEIH